MASTPQQSHNTAVAELRAELGGELIAPGDPGYDEARHVWFRGIDRRPAAIARVAGDVIGARVVRRARERRLELAVRSGGHTAPPRHQRRRSGDRLSELKSSRSTPRWPAWVGNRPHRGGQPSPRGESALRSSRDIAPHRELCVADSARGARFVLRYR